MKETGRREEKRQNYQSTFSLDSHLSGGKRDKGAEKEVDKEEERQKRKGT